MSAAARDFLVEIGTEELPPKALPELERAFAEGIAAGLRAASLAHRAIESFATPRRLAVRVRRLADHQPDQSIHRRGPPVRAAFDASGTPTRAALAFAENCGVALTAIGRESDAKGEYLSWSGTRPGVASAALLPDIVRAALDALPIPKRMRWGSSEAAFVRPVHWVLMLSGDEPLVATVLDTTSGGMTRGHRFMAPRPLRVRTPAGYERVLRTRGRVIASFSERRERIRADVAAAASALGGHALIGEALLDEVTALVEWPVAIAGHFEATFLALPREVLIATLQDHQRYFAIEDAHGTLLPAFVTVSNIESRDPAVVRAGNERVVRPRLADAAFFQAQDRKRPLAARRVELDAVTYQAQLGSQGARVARLIDLAGHVATALGTDAVQAREAAALCKCDLMTAMVGEFPELQGIIGRYYALADGVDPAVAEAIREHYLPRGAGDELPAGAVGIAVAIADKLETIAGIFATGQRPSGTRDPFGLRRAAIGLIRIVRERALELDLDPLIARAVALAEADVQRAAPAAASGAPPPADRDGLAAEIRRFILERLRSQYLDADPPSGVTTEAFDAVLAAEPRTIPDFEARLHALREFLAQPVAATLAAANKRIANILRKSASLPLPEPESLRYAVPEEHRLAAAMESARGALAPALARRDYALAFATLAALAPDIDAFFDRVLVNDPDEALRNNRLALLAALRQLFTRIADLSLLPG